MLRSQESNADLPEAQEEAQAESVTPPASQRVPERRVLIIGGGIAGLAAARELRRRFRVTVVDAKEYFEFTPSIMRAYVDPSHWDSITFLYKDVLERCFGVGFIWGEVKSIDGDAKCACVRTMFSKEEDVVSFDYCLIANGCNFNPFIESGESLWFPVVHERNKAEHQYPHLDQRYLEGRRRRILEEHRSLVELNNREGLVLIVGAGYTGVQWACELQQRFPRLHITVTDFVRRCCGALPAEMAQYCEDYMQSRGIRTVYCEKYNPKSPDYWSKIGLPKEGVDKTFHAPGVKQSNYFMPPTTLTKKGPSGGWIDTNVFLQVVRSETNGQLGNVSSSNSASKDEAKKESSYGDGCIFAVGDCILGDWSPALTAACTEGKEKKCVWTGYVAEQQAVTACQNIICKDRHLYGGTRGWLCCLPFPSICARINMKSTWYPWGMGIWSMSLGPHDGCVVIESYDKSSGRILLSGQKAAAFKELIETTKVSQCRGDHWLSSFIWYMVHHVPINCTKSQAPCLDIGILSSQ